MLKAIIMAGGEGTRLRPLTCDRPKPMVPVMNRPVMEHIINLLKTHGLLNIGVTLHYMPQLIQAYFGDGSEFGVDLRYYIEEIPLGTAGSVRNAADFLNKTFLVISGDALTDIDLSQAIRFHREKQAVATLVLTVVDSPLEYGVVITDPQGRVTQFLEKPSWGEVFSDKVNTGIYILEPQIFQYYKRQQNFDFSKDLFPRLLKDGLPVYGYVAAGYWCDIGNVKAYQQAHFDVLSGKVRINMPYQCQDNQIWVGTDTKIHQAAHIQGPVLIGDNCFIGSEVRIEKFSVIGDNVIIENQASLKRSIVWNNCHIGKKSQLRGATLANRVQVRGNTGIFEGAVIGDDSIIEQHCLIKPNIKIWPSKLVETGTIVNSSLIWGTRCTRALFGNQGITGVANIEITPEFTAKLGAAYGTWLGSGTTVVVGADAFDISQALKHAFVAGLVSTGVQVQDLGRVVSPITRYNIRRLKVKSGVQIEISSDCYENISIRFFDSRGVEISRSDEHKIENYMSREDFRRAEFHQIGTYSFVTDAVKKYLAAILQTVDLSKIRSRHFKVIIMCPNQYLDNLIQIILAKLECDVQVVDTKAVGRDKIEQIKETIISQKADLGVIYDYNMEKLTLVSDTGQLIDEDWFTALTSLLVLNSQVGGTIAVPINATEAIEKMAQFYHGKVVRTKTALQSFMDQLLSDEIRSKQGSDLQFLLHSDGLSALVRVLHHLAVHQVSLSQLVNKIPEFHLSKQVISCPWEAKGRVIRTLIEEQQAHPESLELIEGVKIHYPNGWVLVLPDAEAPVCRIYSEGFSQEIAESLTDWYSERVREIGNHKD